MNILKTCLKAGHRWGVPVPVPYQGDRFPAEEGWLEISRCQRALCSRLRVVYTDLSVVTYDADTERGPYDLRVVAK